MQRCFPLLPNKIFADRAVKSDYLTGKFLWTEPPHRDNSVRRDADLHGKIFFPNNNDKILAYSAAFCFALLSIFTFPIAVHDVTCVFLSARFNGKNHSPCGVRGCRVGCALPETGRPQRAQFVAHSTLLCRGLGVVKMNGPGSVYVTELLLLSRRFQVGFGSALDWTAGNGGSRLWPLPWWECLEAIRPSQLRMNLFEYLQNVDNRCGLFSWKWHQSSIYDGQVGRGATHDYRYSYL